MTERSTELNIIHDQFDISLVNESQNSYIRLNCSEFFASLFANYLNEYLEEYTSNQNVTKFILQNQDNNYIIPLTKDDGAPLHTIFEAVEFIKYIGKEIYNNYEFSLWKIDIAVRLIDIKFPLILWNYYLNILNADNAYRVLSGIPERGDLGVIRLVKIYHQLGNA